MAGLYAIPSLFGCLDVRSDGHASSVLERQITSFLQGYSYLSDVLSVACRLERNWSRQSRV